MDAMKLNLVLFSLRRHGRICLTLLLPVIHLEMQMLSTMPVLAEEEFLISLLILLVTMCKSYLTILTLLTTCIESLALLV